jgi:hypothetical protein
MARRRANAAYVRVASLVADVDRRRALVIVTAE